MVALQTAVSVWTMPGLRALAVLPSFVKPTRGHIGPPVLRLEDCKEIVENWILVGRGPLLKQKRTGEWVPACPALKRLFKLEQHDRLRRGKTPWRIALTNRGIEEPVEPVPCDWQSRFPPMRELWQIYAIGFPQRDLLNNQAARRCSSWQLGLRDFDDDGFSIITVSVPRERSARGTTIEEWLFDLVIWDRKYSPSMRGALRLVLVNGWKNGKAAARHKIKPATVKKATARLRKEAEDLAERNLRRREKK
jgi:hypothetical protein